MVESATGVTDKTKFKTDLRLPRRLGKRIERLCREMGLPKNAFFTLAASQLVAELEPLVASGVNRARLVAETEKVFQRILSRMQGK